jgi:ribosomal protein S18 acetylase RimI-like enzyme
VIPPAEVLAWDSEFFGVRVARAAGTTLSASEAWRLLSWCEVERVELLYFLAGLEPATIREAEKAGFSLMDVRVELSAATDALGSGAESQACRLLRPGDLELLRPIAREAHHDSRFFADPRIPAGRAEELFVRWLERDAALGDQGWAGVIESGGHPAGYVTAAIDAEGRGWIRLIAVGAGARGNGLGRALVAGAGRWLADHGVPETRVVTQARNVSAQRLYQHAGFRTAAVHLWYHKWFQT